MKQLTEINIAIVSSSFREEVVGNLEKNCIETLEQQGVKKNKVNIYRVPGSLEIPLVAKKLAEKNIYDAIITFGAIVKGKTYHFEQISNECARLCMQISYDFGIPVIFEVLAVYDLQDAIDRATRTEENKGKEAALTALEMIAILSKI